jgi:uroporphyrinogen decarboxylase
MASGVGKPLLRALARETLPRPPWWLMRQAGRYLPEYRAVRSKAHDFVELCLTPELAAELTLQPVRRYHMDGAILFSDILLVPHALGQRLTFREREGPILEPIENRAGIGRLYPRQVVPRLEPVFKTITRVAASLGPQTALIGFAGAPWTVATYMVEGGSSRDFRRVKGWAYRDVEGFDALIGILVESTINFLTGQIEAGAEVVQLFDTWAGVQIVAARLQSSTKRPRVHRRGRRTLQKGAGFRCPERARISWGKAIAGSGVRGTDLSRSGQRCIDAPCLRKFNWGAIGPAHVL